ncbi:LysR family transcriptional regulator [Mycobacterium marseillense]|uniref:Probable hydrogen peroxide-inducible genes activator n=1 Tax=Mycobacterium marseillense TaxID=701042 RepID=A0AAC9VU53_9MYCO|nr:LysR family transcriptional regulator [Mycobacterium marseillense]ASW89901.1 LysR family transcriptional regulator [Mycobacterium marseillense]MCA2262389.1 LysR family transcriptional regulator [Mycobacterium marseillense]MDM3973671.1 LysR family transcriptional regulator [Mycobacterium marseillense]OBJ76556.1 LysR family transcriptional regulator [Mycobacterium marseillense]
MLFRQLEYFVAVAVERHFGRAALRCHVSQPALSAAIAKLERELDVTLIERGNNFVGLTPEGERLLPWAKRVVAEHAALKAEMRGMRSGVTGMLRLGTIPTASTTSSLVLSGFCSQHPMVRVQVRSHLATSELYRRLRDFELDAAIVPGAQDEEIAGLDFLPLYEERYFLIAPIGMVPASTTTLPWSDAAKLPLTLLTPEMRVRQIVDGTFADLGISLTPRVETDSVSTLLAQAASGDRACIVPHTWLWTTLMGADLRAIELIDPIVTTPIVVASNSAGHASPLVAAFMQSAQALALDQFFTERLGGVNRR